ADKVIEIPAEPETGARPLKRLRLGARACVVVISPFFAGSRMQSQAEDGQFARDQHFGNNFLIFASLEIGAGVNGVSPCPSRRRKDRVQSVGVGTLVCIWNDLSASLLLIGIGDSPFNHARI